MAEGGGHGSMEKTGPWMKYAKMLHNSASKTHETLKRETAKQAAKLATGIKKNIQTSGNFAGKPFAPLKESTIKRKGSSKPLIDTGDAMGAVAAVKLDELRYLVGVPGGVSGGKTHATISGYMRVHEEGGISEHGNLIVARPFIAPVVEKMKKELLADFEKNMKELFKI